MWRHSPDIIFLRLPSSSSRIRIPSLLIPTASPLTVLPLVLTSTLFPMVLDNKRHSFRISGNLPSLNWLYKSSNFSRNFCTSIAPFISVSNSFFSDVASFEGLVGTMVFPRSCLYLFNDYIVNIIYAGVDFG